MLRIFKKTDAAASPEAPREAKEEATEALTWPGIWRRLGASPSALTNDVLRARIAETVAWCDAVPSLAELRSAPLRPRLCHDGPEDLVCDLGINRQTQLRRKGLQVSVETPLVATGRFMLYFPDENLADGCAEIESGGFFDVDNLPACDTWVTFVDDEGRATRSARRHLLCYVPRHLVKVADAGIEVNPESCIVWLDQSSGWIRRRVEQLASP